MPIGTVRKVFDIHFFDNRGNLSYVFSKIANCDWEYNRKGGCGQCNLVVTAPFDFIESKLIPQTSVKIYVNNQLRYTGKLLRYTKQSEPGNEKIILTFYGYLTELAGIIVRETYENTEISAIVTDILDNYVLPNSEISYSAADIESTDYSVQSLALNHSAKDALVLLAQLGGNIEWGVDRNKNFFFKKTDAVVRRVYVVGREVTMFNEIRNDENIVNILNIFGNAGFLAQIQSTQSVETFGSKEANLFESSITEVSDANRLGFVNLKNSAGYQRNIQFLIIKPDEFIETATPLGATTLRTAVFRGLNKYGTSIKYGTSNRYGNLRPDQIENIRYNIAGGGLAISITMSDDIPSIADTQKRTEFELKDLQRR